MKIHLSKYNWYTDRDISVSGFIFREGRFLREADLAAFFSGVSDINEFCSRLKSASGQFSVIVSGNIETWAAADRTRSWPLFFTREGGEYILGDDPYFLAGLREANEFDRENYISFLAAGYTLNDRTLVKDIFQVEAGSVIVFGDDVTAIEYHNPSLEKTAEDDSGNSARRLSDLLEQTFRNYFVALKDKFIAIPLSGGYDSRLVAFMASRYHPENILCYTYGRKDNPEISIAREAAEKLGLRWINIVYNDDLINDFIHDGFFKDYYSWVSGLTGMFFLQEYFAVRYLKQNGLIPSGTIFMSGYSGDFIAGSYLTPVMKGQSTRKDLSEVILKEYFRYIRLSRSERALISSLIAERIPEGKSDAWKVVETWDLKERHAKFIVNSAKVFTYFGYDYVFPLWDNSLVDFMLPQPFTLRMNRKLYEHALRDIIFAEAGLNLDFETNPSPRKKSVQRLKETIKPLLPGWLRNYFIDTRNQIFYDRITSVLRTDAAQPMIPPVQPNYYNAYIIQWYLFKTAIELKIKPPL